MSSEKNSCGTGSKKGKRGIHRKSKDVSAGIAVIGECVREGRKELHISQRVLAEKIGIGKRTIMDVEADIGNPKFEVLYGLVRELNIPVYRVFYPDIPEEFEERVKLYNELENCTEKELEIILPMVRNLKEILRQQRRNQMQKGPGVKNVAVNAEKDEEDEEIEPIQD